MTVGDGSSPRAHTASVRNSSRVNLVALPAIQAVIGALRYPTAGPPVQPGRSLHRQPPRPRWDSDDDSADQQEGSPVTFIVGPDCG